MYRSDFFSKVWTKNKSFGFHFSKGADNKLTARIPAILKEGGGGGADKKNRMSQSDTKQNKPSKVHCNIFAGNTRSFI